MLESKLKELAEEKAAAVGLNYRDIKTEIFDPFLFPELVVLNRILGVDYVNRNIILSIGDLSGISIGDLEPMLEHLLCKCKDIEEGVHGREVIDNANPLLRGLSLEFVETYRNYFASKRQIKVFGKERFAGFQMRGLQEYFKRIDEIIRREKDSDDSLLAIVSMYAEQVKCSLMETDPQVFPRIVSILAEPFPEAFERINRSGLPWLDKSKILLMMTFYNGMKIALQKSYMKNQLFVTERINDDLSAEFRESDKFNQTSYQVAADVEKLLTDFYRASSIPIPRTNSIH